MERTKPQAIASGLREPRPLCCQHCFAADSLMPLDAEVSPITGEMALHLDLHETAESHEAPRDWPQGMLLVGFNLFCRRKDCERWTHLVLTSGENGTFLQLVPVPVDDAPEEPSTNMLE